MWFWHIDYLLLMSPNKGQSHYSYDFDFFKYFK